MCMYIFKKKLFRNIILMKKFSLMQSRINKKKIVILTQGKVIPLYMKDFTKKRVVD